MIVLPAIDIYDGKAVRLLRGDYAQMTVYGDPLDFAVRFAASGAEWLHLVDLRGARDSGTPAFSMVSDIISETGLKVEIGGGIRTENDIERYLSAGASRIILGTAAVGNGGFLSRVCREYGDAVAVGADINNGCIAVKGWTESSSVTADEYFHYLSGSGVGTVICTDISRDGAMRGANLGLYRRITSDFPMRLIASGGVSGLDDVRALKEIGVYGAIIGKAYYTGAIDIAEALEAAV